MKTLQAGPLIAAYENGFLRRIRYGEAEVVRMIYFALRDRNWDTMESKIGNEKIGVGRNSFSVSYECTHFCEGRPVMRWEALINGNEDATVTFQIAGTMIEDFKKNRAGFCVLHPLTIAGDNCTIVHPDASEETKTFPIDISPVNPFVDVTAMRWRCGGVEFALEFEGDIFETEDQRNWCDASYKTFCTPLRLPFPAEMKKGQTVKQKITLRAVEKLVPPAPTPRNITLTSPCTKIDLPRFGVGASTEVRHLSDEAVAQIRALRFSHYRIEVVPASDKWVADFSSSCEGAYALGLPLEVALCLSDKYAEEMEAFAVLCQQNKVRLKQVLLLSAKAMVTAQPVLDDIMALKGVFPRVAFGAGTNYNFNELNKNRFDATKADFISLAADPQEHAFDDITILENIAALEHLVKSTRGIYGHNTPVHLSPLTLRKRFNPYATNADDFFIEERHKADPRQREVFAAVWTFGAICALARGGASSVTFFQTAGNQGIMSAAGERYPVYEVLKQFAPYQGKALSILESSDPFIMEGVVLDGKWLGVVNYSQDARTAEWEGQYVAVGPREVKFIALKSAQ